MNIKDKLKGLHFFQFSEGRYSDYRVGGLYVCDHPVSEEEWTDHYEKYQAIVAEKRKEFGIIGSTVLDWDEYNLQIKKYTQWYEDNMNHPEESFIKLHKMVSVDCEELWRDND